MSSTKKKRINFELGQYVASYWPNVVAALPFNILKQDGPKKKIEEMKMN